jgi:uncharacterized protein
MKRITFFFATACLISWVIWLPLYADKIGIHDLPMLPYHHALGAWGPLIAAVLTFWLFEPRKLGAYLKNLVRVKSISLLLVAFGAPLLLAVVSMIISASITHTELRILSLLTSKEFPTWSFVGVIAYNFISFGIGEEAGWRGFALPVLQQKYGALLATSILSMIWAIWHLPLFLYRPGYMNMDMGGIAGWLASLYVGAILLTWLFNSSRGSVLICGVFHALIDVAFTASFSDANVVSLLGMFITFWGIAVLIYFWRTNSISRMPKHTGLG